VKPPESVASPPAPSQAALRAPRVHQEDLDLVHRILAGDAGAWEFFVERYAGLILAMSRRYLATRDQDDVRNVFVSTLQSLLRTRLRTYEGRASLSTWLTLVARSEVVDHLRRRFGRDLKIRALNRLTAEERQLFRLYCIEGLPYGEVVARLSEGGRRWSADEFVAALHRVESRLGDRRFKRLSYDLHARSIGVASGRLLEYFDQAREELGERSDAQRPEYETTEREARATLDQLRASIAALRPLDQQLIELRFEHGWTAGRIAEELGMKGQRSVYKALDRVVARLRRLLQKDRGRA